MRSFLAAALSGWLLSCWVQVPPPLQDGLKTVARWIVAKVSNKASAYEARMNADAPSTASIAEFSTRAE